MDMLEKVYILGFDNSSHTHTLNSREYHEESILPSTFLLLLNMAYLWSPDEWFVNNCRRQYLLM